MKEIREAGGAIFALTSEPQSLATEAQDSWDFDYPGVGDPHHEIKDMCRDRGWMDLFVNKSPHLGKERDWVAHPKGYFQPGVIALAKDGRVLYRWRSRPTRQNLGGTLERPTPEHVWQEVQSRLDNAGDEPALDERPKLDGKAPPWPLFVAILLAHGWFLRPKPFPLGRADEPKSAKFNGMPMRIAGFAALWIAAFALLPTSWVAIALAGWAAFVTPKLIELHRAFQNVPEGEPEHV